MSVKINKNVTYIINKINKYKDFSVNNLKELFKIESNSKNLNSLIIKQILKTERIELDLFNLSIKTSSICNKHIKESMSLPTFNFLNLINETWIHSKLYTLLNNGILICFFNLVENEYVFDKVKFWIPSESDLIEAKKVWEKTKKVLESGEIINSLIEINKNNFPKITHSYLLHVRPHGINKNDTFELPIPDNLTGRKYYTKQSFWINSSFLEHIYSSY